MSAVVTTRTALAEAVSYQNTRAIPSAISRPTPLGGAVPNGLPHAISVSLPTWKDVVGYEEGEKRVVDSMCTGYPRFFINKMIQKLAIICHVKFGKPDEQCLLFPTSKIGESCRKFMLQHSPTPLSIRLVRWLIAPTDQPYAPSEDCVVLHILFFPSDSFGLGKQFWQHTGLGISSRVAERCLALLAPREPGLIKSIPINPTRQRSSKNRHYLVQGIATQEDEDEEAMTAEHATYLEERYGRNLPRSDADLAKRTLRKRIAGVLARDSDPTQSPSRTAFASDTAPTARRVENLSEDDVFLFPTGMSSIWTAHQLAMAVKPLAKSVCFGFPYTDTLKILQKWGPGCHFFGHGTDQDLVALETLLESGESILALFCEFPSNPLLRSPNLRKLRELANKYNFVIVCDETIGNFANVEVLPWVDMVVSSLTKVFSGETNVMGGGLVLNPHAPHYLSLKKGMADIYEDCYWGEDAIYLERNSRDFSKRVKIINDNAAAVVDLLRSRSRDHHVPSPSSPTSNHFAVKSVYYPKYVTREHYDACRLPDGGYGGLFSVTFTSQPASRAFFDALRCEKGPSLGTNFTLACPYTILAHYTELDWADQFGVERGLVRASVGLEERDVLESWISEAIQAAEDAVKEERGADPLNAAK